MLAVGDTAPEFEARDCQGRTVRLGDYRGRRLVLFFFPKAFTSGCTEEIRAELVGVSVDRPEVQCEFARSEKIEYPLLGDNDRKISDRFGVLWPLVRINRRVTFVVTPEGRIEEVIQHERQVWRHLDDVIAALQKRVGASAPA